MAKIRRVRIEPEQRPCNPDRVDFGGLENEAAQHVAGIIDYLQQAGIPSPVGVTALIIAAGQQIGLSAQSAKSLEEFKGAFGFLLKRWIEGSYQAECLRAHTSNDPSRISSVTSQSLN